MKTGLGRGQVNLRSAAFTLQRLVGFRSRRSFYARVRPNLSEQFVQITLLCDDYILWIV